MNARTEVEAGWMAMHLSAATGEAITPAMLLGREDEELAAKEAAGNKRVDELLAKLPGGLSGLTVPTGVAVPVRDERDLNYGTTP